jgi:hypothetical protein
MESMMGDGIPFTCTGVTMVSQEMRAEKRVRTGSLT